jgi:hypothetical protein
MNTTRRIGNMSLFSLGLVLVVSGLHGAIAAREFPVSVDSSQLRKLSGGGDDGNSFLDDDPFYENTCDYCTAVNGFVYESCADNSQSPYTGSGIVYTVEETVFCRYKKIYLDWTCTNGGLSTQSLCTSQKVKYRDP